MEPLIFYEKHLPGGSEPNDEQLIKTGTISLGGREDLYQIHFYYDDFHAGIVYGDGRLCSNELGMYYGLTPCGSLYTEFWRSGASEISYRIKLGEDYVHGGSADLVSHADAAIKFDAEFNSGDNLSLSLPISIVNENDYDKGKSSPLTGFDFEVEYPYLPKTVDWDFGGLENIYIPGNYSDPWRYQFFVGDMSDYDISHTRWGRTKDGAALLRVYEDALPAQSSLELMEIKPNGEGIRNYRAENFFAFGHHIPIISYKVFYNGKEYELPDGTDTSIDMGVGTITFGKYIYSNAPCGFTFVLNKNVDHPDHTRIDVFNQVLTFQVARADGVATHDILVQIVDDAPFVRGDATMDLSGVAAWTLGGNKLPLSYDYLKDVLYRSTDYNDWATGFRVTNCEGKYGSIGVFADDGNPDDPATAPGNAYYMVDPAKITFVAPDQVVTEAVEYSYTDSDGDTANGVLNIVLKGTGLNPAEAIDITPRPGNVPTSGGDVPADNPYVPGNPGDPDRDLNSSGAGDYDPMNPNWGLSKDGNVLLRVFESGLPNGSEAGQRNVTAHGWLDIDATVGLQSLRATTDDTNFYVPENNLMTIPLDGGTLTLTQNPAENSVYYEFALANPIMHEPGNGINSDEQHVKLIATDNFGNEETIGLEVQIIDDVPVPKPGYEGHGILPYHALCNWIRSPLSLQISGDFLSTDSIHGYGSYSVDPHEGNYGSFKVEERQTNWGSYTEVKYTVDQEKTASLKCDEFLIEPLKYIYTDDDGDSAEINCTIYLHGPAIKPIFTINESELAKGCELTLPGLEITYASNYYCRYGSVSQDLDGIWRYKLSHAIDSGPVQGSNVTFITTYDTTEIFLRVKDSYGFDVALEPEVAIIDSVPTFTASQNMLAYDFGADNGPGSGLKVAVGGAEIDLAPGVETMIAGQHGLLTLSADGSCRYAPNSDYAGEDRFDFTIIDSDGDRALATVIASVQDGAPQTSITVQDADSLAVAAIGAAGAPGEPAGFAGA